MPVDLGPRLIALAMLGVVALAYYIQTRLHNRRPRVRDVGLALCAWCVRQDGDDCTHPESPVHGRRLWPCVHTPSWKVGSSFPHTCGGGPAGRELRILCIGIFPTRIDLTGFKNLSGLVWPPPHQNICSI